MSEKNCYSCKHMRTIPGDAHITCVKPDPRITIKYWRKWFLYPFNFDPVWMPIKCSNYEKKE